MHLSPFEHFDLLNRLGPWLPSALFLELKYWPDQLEGHQQELGRQQVAAVAFPA